uniref:Uncharacterized protein n=1 Tax=Heterorhabditis bacteriophora TaxID=37862 RepID=A0A1I7W6K1_HETBA
MSYSSINLFKHFTTKQHSYITILNPYINYKDFPQQMTNIFMHLPMLFLQIKFNSEEYDYT